MHVSAPFSLDPASFFHLIFTALFIVLGLLYLVKNTASNYFEVDANFDQTNPPSTTTATAVIKPRSRGESEMGHIGGGSVEGECVICGGSGTKRCSGCKTVRYCSARCQSKHWKAGHKLKCKDSSGCRGKAYSSEGKPSSELVKLKKVLFPYEEFVRLYNWGKLELPPCGLVNCGNSCYANVVLQCLSFTKPLIAYLLEKRHRRECRRNFWCFMCELQIHVERIVQSSQPFSPLNILSRLPNIGSNLGYGKQEDAHEFMRFAIDTMQSVCLDEFGGEKALHSSSQETTLIQYIFGGHLQSQVACTKCNKLSYRYENMMDLTVEIQGDAASLEDCLDQFTVKEWLDGENMYKCDGCNDYVKACKRLTIHQVPNILTIALKRFQSGRFGKLNKRVTFPETLDLGPYMSNPGDGNDSYQLYAVVVHVDMLNASYFGHYICYTKDYCGTWYRIDDDKVTMVELEEVLLQGAYMLLYSRTFVRPTCAKLLESSIEEKQHMMEVVNKSLTNSQQPAISCTVTMSRPSETSIDTEDPTNTDLVKREDLIEMDLDGHIKFNSGSLDTLDMDQDDHIKVIPGSISLDLMDIDNDVSGNCAAEIVLTDYVNVEVSDASPSGEPSLSAPNLEREILCDNYNTGCSSQDINSTRRSCDKEFMSSQFSSNVTQNTETGTGTGTSKSVRNSFCSEENLKPMFSRGFLDKSTMLNRNRISQVGNAGVVLSNCNNFQIHQERNNANTSVISLNEVADKRVGGDLSCISSHLVEIACPVHKSLSNSALLSESTSAIENLECKFDVDSGLESENETRRSCDENITLSNIPMDISFQNSVDEVAETSSVIPVAGAVSESEMLHEANPASFESLLEFPLTPNTGTEILKSEGYSSCFEEKLKPLISPGFFNNNCRVLNRELKNEAKNEAGRLDKISIHGNEFLKPDLCCQESNGANNHNGDFQSLLSSSPIWEQFESPLNVGVVSDDLPGLVSSATSLNEAHNLQCEEADTKLNVERGLENGNPTGSSYIKELMSLESKSNISVSSAAETSDESEIRRSQSKQTLEVNKVYPVARTEEVKSSKLARENSCSVEELNLPFRVGFLDKCKKQRHLNRNGEVKMPTEETVPSCKVNSNGNGYLKPHSLHQNSKEANDHNGVLNCKSSLNCNGVTKQSKNFKNLDRIEIEKMEEAADPGHHPCNGDATPIVFDENIKSNNGFGQETTQRTCIDLFSPGFLNRPLQKKFMNNIKTESKDVQEMVETKNERMDESDNSLNSYSSGDSSSMFSDESTKIINNVLEQETIRGLGRDLFPSGFLNRTSRKKPLHKEGEDRDNCTTPIDRNKVRRKSLHRHNGDTNSGYY
ncbi:hypothetical protein GIB67_018658 [Kingdonia uniflora]|uniref:Uncharacterized protein n=1 Tax=Kingdonia uniflora TaxID=39325 RepID=A0A7J7M2L4_9MAGN|nr:hypothetical protein GIB67_018658 [Kingdonia uniflora]